MLQLRSTGQQFIGSATFSNHGWDSSAIFEMTINIIILPPMVIKPFVTPVQGVNAADVHSAGVKYISKNKWNCSFSGIVWGLLVCCKNTNLLSLEVSSGATSKTAALLLLQWASSCFLLRF